MEEEASEEEEAVGNIEYTYKGQTFPVNIIRKNNKNTYIRVDDNLNINITTSYLVSKTIIKDILTKNTKSINKMIDNKITKLEKINSINENNILLFGKRIYVVYSDSFKDTEMINDTIYTTDIKKLNKYLNNIITKTYLANLNCWYNTFEENIPYPTLKIRKMKTRWGVCNYKKNIVTLNLELINYDISCLNYVIIHELSHFIYQDHSKHFWAIVNKYCPNYKEVRNILKKT